MTAARLVTRLLTLTKCPTLHLGTKGPTLGSLAEQARAWRVRQAQQRVRLAFYFYHFSRDVGLLPFWHKSTASRAFTVLREKCRTFTLPPPYEFLRCREKKLGARARRASRRTHTHCMPITPLQIGSRVRARPQNSYSKSHLCRAGEHHHAAGLDCGRHTRKEAPCRHTAGPRASSRAPGAPPCF